MEAFTDIYPEPKGVTNIEFDLHHINALIGKQYPKERVLEILHTISVELEGDTLSIPLWRKDLTNIADIAEEVARLDGYDKVEMTVPRINLGAITQSPIYSAKRNARNHLVAKGYYEMYTYSFVDEALMKKVLDDTSALVPMKNALSEEMTHLRGGLIPNLLDALRENVRDFKNMKLFECEKVFRRTSQDSVHEFYELAGVEQISGDNAYYEVQNTLSDLFAKLGVLKYSFDTANDSPAFAHSGRTANIVVRGQAVGLV